MNGNHWLMLAMILLAGYAIGRFFPKPGQMVGLP
jgi:hypothetical protein